MAARPPPTCTQQAAEPGPGLPLDSAGLWKERGARMAQTESILNLITPACYEPMTLCIYKDLSNLLSPDAHTNYANSMQKMQ